MNVLLSLRGAVVIDWTNAGRGPAGVDVADTWLVLAIVATGSLPELAAAGPGAAMLVRGFLDQFLEVAAAADASRHLRAAATRRALDPHLSESEREAMLELAAREAR